MPRIAQHAIIAFTLTVLLLAPLAALRAADAPPVRRPNILFILAEDICPNLGCYGDPNAVTPNLDRFAAEGVRFTNCFSVHPCCSPSRSALVTGVYPTRLGTFQHRAKMWVNPTLVKCFPTLLRAAGYYCFNGFKGSNPKLDYEFDPQDRPWDKIGSKEIEWRNRPAGHPFFGQINIWCTHQSRYGLRPPGGKTVNPKAYMGEPTADRVHDPDKIVVPPYLPDTPAVREIWAEYCDRITQADGRFAALLKQLADDGLADDTIVIFIGDNGHGVPSGKVWLWDEGPHVPLLVHVPEKWASLASEKPGTVSDRLVSFVDFAPTMLSLAGVAIPSDMQGSAFLGPQSGQPRRYVYAARDFHDGADFDTCRMVRDERFYYLRNFMPQISWDAIQYSWQRVPYMLHEWGRYAQAGKLSMPDTRQACFFRRRKPVEELYDMQTDPWQLHNLAGDPKQQATLQRLRAECEHWMVENRDLGLLSQHELYARSEKDSPLEMGMAPQRNPIRQLLDAANVANRCDAAAIPRLRELLTADDGAVRRWGAIGLLALGAKAAPATETLLSALKDPAPDVRMTAAEAVCGLGHVDEAVPVLIALLSDKDYIIRNETLVTLCRIGPVAKTALPYLDKALAPGAQHRKIWSYDNVAAAIPLAQACLGDVSDAKAKLKLTRQKYLP